MLNFKMDILCMLDVCNKGILTSSQLQEELNKGIAAFYDQSSGLWEQMWGEHMHHGYYPASGPKKSNLEAQVDMIEEVLKWASVTDVKKVNSFLLSPWLAHSILLCEMLS